MMWYHYAFVLLVLAAVTVAPAAGLDEPAAPAAAKPKISGSYTCQNLAVYLIHGQDVLPGKNFLTLQEALEQGKVVVREKGTVSELAVENVSKDAEVFIQAGDIVKGGRQDRVIAFDMILSPESGQVRLSCFCVEANRWQRRGDESADRFSASSGQLPGKGLRLAVNSARNQGQVWDKVREQQTKLSKTLNKNLADPRSPSSLQLTLEDKDLQAKIDTYSAKLSKLLDDKPDAIGFVVAINGRVEGAEVYGSAVLLRKMWPKLLRALAIDALSDLRPGRKFEPVETDAIPAFLHEADQGKPAIQNVSDRIQAVKRESERSVSVETKDSGRKGAVIHRSIIAK